MIRTRLVSLNAGFSKRKQENLQRNFPFGILDLLSHVTSVARISYMVLADLSKGDIPYR